MISNFVINHNHQNQDCYSPIQNSIWLIGWLIDLLIDQLISLLIDCDWLIDQSLDHNENRHYKKLCNYTLPLIWHNSATFDWKTDSFICDQFNDQLIDGSPCKSPFNIKIMIFQSSAAAPAEEAAKALRVKRCNFSLFITVVSDHHYSQAGWSRNQFFSAYIFHCFSVSYCFRPPLFSGRMAEKSWTGAIPTRPSADSSSSPFLEPSAPRGVLKTLEPTGSKIHPCWSALGSKM